MIFQLFNPGFAAERFITIVAGKLRYIHQYVLLFSLIVSLTIFYNPYFFFNHYYNARCFSTTPSFETTANPGYERARLSVLLSVSPVNL